MCLLCLCGLTTTGASLNPAKTTSLAVVNGMYANLWIYWSAPYLGALIAVLICGRAKYCF
jgi:aquaporin NIP